jgi:D-glycero-D-manno-heptose 1,7-bisphosphate phosphatase
MCITKGLIISNLKKRIIFLDRDGVINHDHGYVGEISKFDFIDGIFEACYHFIKLGYEIVVITNQSGIGRRYYSEKDFTNLTNWMIEEFKKKGIDILKVYHCPHSPEEDCKCRKPEIGMITQATNDFDIDLEKSWLIGDKVSDIQAAINANIKNTILIKSSYNKIEDKKIASITTNNLFDSINIIKS